MRHGVWWIVGFATLALIGVGYLFIHWQLSSGAQRLVVEYGQMSEEEILQDATRRAEKLGVGLPGRAQAEMNAVAEAYAEHRAEQELYEQDLPPPTFDPPVTIPAPSPRRSGVDPTGDVQGAPVVEAELERRVGFSPGAVKPAMSAEQVAQVRRAQAQEAAKRAQSQLWSDALLFLGVLLVLTVFIGVGLYIWLVMGRPVDAADAADAVDAPAPPPTRAPKTATPVLPGPAIEPPNPTLTPDIAAPMYREPALRSPPNLAPPPNLGREPTPASRSPRGPVLRPRTGNANSGAPQYRSPAPTPRRPLPRLSSATPPSAPSGRPNAGPQYYTPVGVPGPASPPPKTIPDPTTTPFPAAGSPGVYVPDPTLTPAPRSRVDPPDEAEEDVFTPVQSFRTARPDTSQKPARPKMPWLDEL